MTVWIAVLALMAAAVLAYLNSFSGVFLFDDHVTLSRLSISNHWNLFSTVRPLIDLSMTLNYRLGGMDVAGYHAVNLFIHLLAGLVLFGLLRRSLGLASVGFSGTSAFRVAFVSSLWWLLHPIQTESVTYISGRAEALMGLFYLLTLYGFARSLTSKRGFYWLLLSVLCSLLGMASKAIMVTAPLIVLFYDRTFCAHSWREIIRRRGGYYAALFSTWIFLILFLWVPYYFHAYKISHVFPESIASPLRYFLTQPRVIGHYLRLIFWPDQLCLDYVLPLAKPSSDTGYWIGAVIVLGTTAILVKRFPKPLFLAVWFLLILAPSSSFFPLADLVCERRVYLPLAAWTTALAIGVERLTSCLKHRKRRLFVFFALVFLIAAPLGLGTASRNRDYQDAVTMWTDVISKQPQNARAYNNCGVGYRGKGLLDEAILDFDKAIQLKPDYADAYGNRGAANTDKGLYDLAISDLNKAIQIKPDYARAYNTRGIVYQDKGLHNQAIADFKKAIQIKPDYAPAYYNRGNAYRAKGLYDQAVSDFTKAIQIKPDLAEAYNNRGNAYRAKGLSDQAIRDFDKAIQLKPDYIDAYSNRGNAYYAKGFFDQAILDFDKVIQIKPELPEAYNNRGNAYNAKGLWELAISDFDKAIQIKPNLAQAYYNRGNAYRAKGLYEQAVLDFDKAIQLKPDYAKARASRKFLEDLKKADITPGQG